MSEPTDVTSVLGQVGMAGGPAALIGIALRFWHNQGQARLETTLAVLVQKVDQLAADQEKHEKFGERLALAEQSIKAAHERLDGEQQPRRQKR